MVALAILVFLVTSISRTFGRDTYEVRFEVPSTFGIFEGFDDVRFRGVPAGTISAIERDGTQLVVVATIRSTYGPVYTDADAAIRPITPLNDVYLDIVDPGTEARARRTPTVPSTSRRRRRASPCPRCSTRSRRTSGATSTGSSTSSATGWTTAGCGSSAPSSSLAPFLEQAGDLTHQIAVRSEATKRLIHNTGVLTTELGRRENQLRRLVATGAATLGTLQEGSADLDATLAELGPTFTELRASLAAVRGVVDDVDTGLTSLYPVAEKLPRALMSVRGINAALVPTIDALERPVKALGPFAQQVYSAATRGAPALEALIPQVPTVDRLTQRLVDCEDGVIGFFQWNASLSKYGDQTAPIPRGNVAFGIPAFGAPGEPRRDPVQACAPGRPDPRRPDRGRQALMSGSADE